MVYLYLGRNKFNGTQPDPLVVTALCASSAQLPNDNTCFVCMGACVFVFESILSSLDTLLLVIANQNFQGINSVRRTRPMTDENCCIAQSEVCILHQFSNQLVTPFPLVWYHRTHTRTHICLQKSCFHIWILHYFMCSSKGQTLSLLPHLNPA